MNDEINNLTDRLRRMETSIKDSPLVQSLAYDYDPRVPAVTHAELSLALTSSGVTQVSITFLRPTVPNFSKVEIWVAAYGSSQPTLISTVRDSPAAFSLSTTAGTVVVAYLRTVLSNGLSTALDASPTVTFTA